MPPFWKSLLGGGSSSSSSTAITSGINSSNSSSSISNSGISASSPPSSSLSSPRKGSGSTPSAAQSAASPAASSNGSTNNRHLHTHQRQQDHNSRSSPIVMTGGTHSAAGGGVAAAPSGGSASNSGAPAGIPIPHQQGPSSHHQHSTSIASSSALSSANSFADDTDDASIPETPYSTGHSPSHARHKFPQDGSTNNISNSKPAGRTGNGGRTDSSGSGAETNDDEADTFLSDDDNDEEDLTGPAGQGDSKSSKMSTSFTSGTSSTSSSSGVPNARQSPFKPDIPTTHTILANPLPQPSSGLAAAISSVLPSSSSSSNNNSSSNTANANVSSSNGKAGLGSPSTSSAVGGANAPEGPRTFDIDDMISRLLETGYSGKISKSVSLKNGEITALCLAAREVFLSQPTLLELSPPVNIVGDVHGQYSDLIRLFEMCSFPPHANYLFLGDYVDRGKQSLETILLLLCYKVKYPENFFLLRGNHECANVTRVYGFYDECKRRCNLKIWKTFVDVFNCLPIAALVAGKIFCVHGGLSPSLSSMDDIRRISRPTDVPDYGLLNDLLWSDPSDTALDWEDNERGVSYCFGKAVIQEFLAKYDFDLICRAHMVVEDGYEFWNDRTLVTIFSAPNYCGEFDNFASSMLVNEDLLCSFELLKPLDGPALKKELAKCRKKNSAGLLSPRPTV